jgi:hypothetical protein
MSIKDEAADAGCKPRRLVEPERREANTLLREQMAGLAELRDIQAWLMIEEGVAFEATLRVAEAQAADLVILGKHRRQPLRDIFVGAMVERIMRHGNHPVLMVNQPVAGRMTRASGAGSIGMRCGVTPPDTPGLGAALLAARQSMPRGFDVPCPR